MISRREALSRGAALLSTALLPSLASARSRSIHGIAERGQLRLSNGRCLAYHRFGDPTGPLVFYFHGTPGAGLEGGLIEDEAALAGVHLVAIDRPGIGRSTYYSGRRVVDWPAGLCGPTAAALTLQSKGQESPSEFPRGNFRHCPKRRRGR